MASELGRSPAQVALRWALDRRWMTSVIIGARTAAQAEDSLRAAGWQLPEAARQRLDAMSRLPWRYPRAMEAGMRARRDNAVKPPRLTPS